MANGYGTSSTQLQEVMRAQQMLESSRNRPTTASQRGRADTSDDLTDYFKSELDAQRQSRVGRTIQKYTMYPGALLGGAARFSQDVNLDKKIRDLAKLMSKSGGGKGGNDQTAELINTITKAGGLGYMASVAPLNIMRQKRLAYERGMKGQLGGVGTASSAFDSISMLNRMMVTPRVASMIYGGGMPGSVQRMMGMYGATTPMLSGALKAANILPGVSGLKLPAMLAKGTMGASVMNMLGPMALQMGLSMYKQKKIAAITAQRKTGSEEESRFSLSKGLDSQISMLAQKGLIQPGEQIRIQLLKWVESHTSVLPEIWAEQKYIREEKEKGSKGASKAYGKSLGEKEELGLFGDLVDRFESFTSRTLAKFDPFGQIFNFLSTGKSPKQFQEDLEKAYSRTDKSDKELKGIARVRGISIDQSRLLEMTSRQIVDMGSSHEAKLITLLSAQFDVQRYFATELLTIRKVGFGIPDTLIKSDDYKKSGFSKLFDYIKKPFEMVSNIPGLNAVFNAIAAPFKVVGGMRNIGGKIWGGIRNFMLGGENTVRLLSSEEEIRKESGIYKSDQQMAYDYVGRGLPDIMEEMRFLGAVRAQLLTNIYHVLSAQLETSTGQRPVYDQKPFSGLTKRGVWSYTAGKYLNEVGLKEQQKQDQERMEITLERSFRGSAMDRLGMFLDFFSGKDRGKFGAKERLEEASKKVSKVETLPYRLLAGESKSKLGNMGRIFASSVLQNIGEQEFVYSPQELIEAARFRQREMRGKARARVIPGWMGAEQERAQMGLQQDIIPKIQRQLGVVKGGISSIAGMGTLGLAASVASGGSLLPIILALTAGATAGVIPQTTMELKAAQKLFEGIDLNIEDIRKISLGYAGMPDTVTSEAHRTKVREYYKKTNPEFFEKTIKNNEEEFFKNVNNFPYVMMALQGETALNFLKTSEKSGIPVTSAAFNSLGSDITPGDYKTINDLFQALTTRNSPVPIEIVKIGKELGGAVPTYLKDPAKTLQLILGDKDDDDPSKTPSQVSGSSNLYQFVKAAKGILPPGEKEEFEKGMAIKTMQTGGDVKRTGLHFLHKGEKVIPPPGGARDLKQELQELEGKKWEQKLLDKFETMVVWLEDIAKNTDSIDSLGKKKKEEDDKSGGIGGVISDLASKFTGGIGSIISTILGVVGGGISIKYLAKKGLKWAGQGISNLAKSAGRGALNIASKFGAGFMESGTGQAISNKLFDAQFAIRGLAKKYAPTRLLGLAKEGIKGGAVRAGEFLSRFGSLGTRGLSTIPGVSRAGQFLSRAGSLGMEGLSRSGAFLSRFGSLGTRGLSVLPEAMGKGAGNLLGTVGRGVSRFGSLGMRGISALPGVMGPTVGNVLGTLGKGAAKLGTVGINALLGVGGTVKGAIKAQEEYGDAINTKLSLGQKIGLGAGTGLKWMTGGLLDIGKLTGADQARDQLVAAKEQLAAANDKFRANMASKCSPSAFKILDGIVGGKGEWAGAFMSAKMRGLIIPGGPGSKYLWIIPGEEVIIDTNTKTNPPKTSEGIKWHTGISDACEQYIYSRSRNDIAGMEAAARIIATWEKELPVEKVVSLYEKSGRKQKITKDQTEKKPTITTTQKIKKAHDINMSPAGLALAQANAGIDNSILTKQPTGIWESWKQKVSEEGGVWGAIKATISQKSAAPTTASSTPASSIPASSIPASGGIDDIISPVTKSTDPSSKGGLVWPGSNLITSPFGLRNTGLKGASRNHKGVDMRADEVISASDGIVDSIDDQWGGITINHGNNFGTRYLHLRNIDVKKGDKVSAGQKIGMAGNKGPIAGMKKHLHFEVLKGGAKVDPELVYNSMGKFSPSYAPDISDSRKLSAKLGGQDSNLSNLKTEGAEAAGPFGYSAYDPIEVRGSLQKNISDIQNETKQKEASKVYAQSSRPIIMPVSTGSGSVSPENEMASKAKRATDVESELDMFIETLFNDACHEFSQRYKMYAYHSNIGHSFI